MKMNKIGKYRTIKKIGKGGNGIVYEVGLNKDRFAMKTLIDFSKTNKYARFRDEVKALKDMGPIDNVVTLIDHNLPAEPRKQDVPFYVMPLGIPFAKYIEGKNHDKLILAFLKIAKAVQVLHEKEYTHRDIKPDNLLFIDNEPVLSDFGLVSFPDKDPRSGNNEKIGPQWTIAPEMKRTSSTAEFKKADVYSLAKTLWILITGSKFGFEGQYIPNSNISLNNYVEVMINKQTNAGQWYYHSTVILDQLLNAATDNDPEKRPSAEEFYKILKFWFESNDDFKTRNPYEWEDALQNIFPHGIPDRCEWLEHNQILSVLSVLVNYDNLNHFFYPNRGGDDMKSIALTSDNKKLVVNKNILIEPEKLVFRSNSTYKLSYFRLIVKPSDRISNDQGDGIEEEYISDQDYNFIANLGEDYEEGIEISKYLKGSFVFVNKRSKINALKGVYRNDLYLDGYSGIHDLISHNEYHDMLSAKI